MAAEMCTACDLWKFFPLLVLAIANHIIDVHEPPLQHPFKLCFVSGTLLVIYNSDFISQGAIVILLFNILAQNLEVNNTIYANNANYIL